MSNMTSKQRVLAALNRKEPDRVPFLESLVDREMQIDIMGKEDFAPVDFVNEIGLDAIRYDGFLPPIFANKQKDDYGKEIVLDGLITSRDKLDMLRLPDPNDEAMYEDASRFIQENKGDRAIFALIRLGISPTLLSMGIEGFSEALFDDIDFLLTVLRTYAEWTAQVMHRVNQLGFDFIWAADDIAFESGPMFSPKVFREVIIPQLKIAASSIELPWIYHSDGNLMPVLNDLINELKPNAIHPIDPKGMDLKEAKEKYGDRVCLIGNIDLNYTLTMGTPEEVDEEVKQKIQIAGPGGGYIVSSANSITSYCKKENVLAMAQAIKKYGKYPITS